MNSIFQDKARGALLGGAVGDALGYPVEFIYSHKEICDKYGAAGICEYLPANQWLNANASDAQFSDDTQMTLYTAEGLLEAENKSEDIISKIRDSYLAWYGHQAGRKVKISYDSKLAKIPELNQNRAPGNTCMSALATIYSGKEATNNSKGCGGIMRVAPFGIYGAAHKWPLAKTARLAGEAAELTHKHPLSTYSSAALAVLVQLCLNEESVGVERFKQLIGLTLTTNAEVYGEAADYMADFRKIVADAISAADDERDDWEVIEQTLGGGWVADETLAIVIFSVLRHIDSFRDCMICAVNHGGDSDSTGAVAGNVIGAILGLKAIPATYITNLQASDLLLSFADALAE